MSTEETTQNSSTSVVVADEDGGVVCVKFADGSTEWRFHTMPLPQPPPVPLQSTVPPWLADSFRAVERAQLTVRSALDSVEHLALKLDKMRGQTTEEEPWKLAECQALRDWPALWRRQATFRSLLAECNELGEGTRLSRRARDDRTEGGTVALAAASGESASLTYGEVESVVLFWVLLRDVLLRMMPSARIPYDGTATFADIGCGSGRALVAAALLPFILSADDGNDDGNDDEDNAESAEASFFAQCYGVEILAPLAEAAVTAGEKLAAMGEVIDDGMNYVDNVARRGGKLLVECGKLEESIESWAGCDVVYAASTCFSKALLGAVIENAAQNMRPGALLISLRMPDQDTEYARTLARAFEPEVSLGPYFMSWGSSVVHCFVKK